MYTRLARWMARDERPDREASGPRRTETAARACSKPGTTSGRPDRHASIGQTWAGHLGNDAHDHASATTFTPGACGAGEPSCPSMPHEPSSICPPWPPRPCTTAPTATSATVVLSRAPIPPDLARYPEAPARLDAAMPGYAPPAGPPRGRPERPADSGRGRRPGEGSRTMPLVGPLLRERSGRSMPGRRTAARLPSPSASSALPPPHGRRRDGCAARGEDRAAAAGSWRPQLGLRCPAGRDANRAARPFTVGDAAPRAIPSRAWRLQQPSTPASAALIRPVSRSRFPSLSM